MKSIFIINGVNLISVGSREPTIYGTYDLVTFMDELSSRNKELQITSKFLSGEGEIVDVIHQLSGNADAVIINPGAYTHSSIAIADALRSLSIPSVEVHISQVFAREPYRRKSYIAEVCKASISGMGIMSYQLAIEYLKSSFA